MKPYEKPEAEKITFETEEEIMDVSMGPGLSIHADVGTW